MGLGIFAFAFGLAFSTVLGKDLCLPDDSDNVYHQAFDGKCYYFFTSSVNYRGAEHHCNNIGGLLAQPKTKEINDALAETMRNNSKINQRAWIGLSDRKQENLYRWADGNILNFRFDFDNFGKGEGPNANTVKRNWEDIVALDPSGSWHDYRDSLYAGPFTVDFKKLPYICEAVESKTTQTAGQSTPSFTTMFNTSESLPA